MTSVIGSLALLLYLAGALAEPVAGPVVELLPTAAVSDAIIRLGDVARLSPESGLEAVDLGAAPLPGRQRTLNRGNIELRLLRAGHDPDAMSFGGAESVVVQRVARQLSADDVARALAGLLPLEVVIERLPPRRALPAGALDFRLRGNLPQPLPERFSVALDVLVDGRLADQLSLGVRRVLPELPAAAAAEPLAPEVVLQAPLAETQPRPQPSPEATANEAPTVATAANPVAERPAWEVKRGDPLTVTAISGKVRISLPGEARAAGRAGDVIEVQIIVNQQRRTVAARLIAPDRAQMEL